MNNRTVWDLKEVEELGKEGKLVPPDSQEYWFTSSDRFPWQEAGDVVTGRLRIDNYILVFALQQGITVIDGTTSTLCLHQVGVDGVYASNSTRMNCLAGIIFAVFLFIYILQMTKTPIDVSDTPIKLELKQNKIKLLTIFTTMKDK